MSLLSKYETFAEEKEKLLSETFNFKNKELPIIQTVDELKEEYSFGDIRKDRIKMLDQQLANIEKLIQAKTDYIPILEPWHSWGVYASAFGCETKWHDNNNPDNLSVISNPKDVYDLKPDLANSELMKMTLDTIKYFQNKVGTSIPISICDPNGPSLCASLVMKMDKFFMRRLMLNNYKKELHYLIDLTTRVFIEFTERQLDILKNPAFPGHNYVNSKSAEGLCISVDILAPLSPDVIEGFPAPALVEEFVVPALEKIAERFGGVYVHACGNWMMHLDVLLKMKGLKGINLHASPAEMDPEVVLRKIKNSGKDISVFCDFGNLGIKWTDYYKDEKDAYVNWYLKKILRNGTPKGVFISTFDNYPETPKFGFGYLRDNVSIEQMSADYDWIKLKIKEILEENRLIAQ